MKTYLNQGILQRALKKGSYLHLKIIQGEVMIEKISFPKTCSKLQIKEYMNDKDG